MGTHRDRGRIRSTGSTGVIVQVVPGAVTGEEPDGVTAAVEVHRQVVRSALTSAGEPAHG
jgi:hypothetical protein